MYGQYRSGAQHADLPTSVLDNEPLKYGVVELPAAVDAIDDSVV